MFNSLGREQRFALGIKAPEVVNGHVLRQVVTPEPNDENYKSNIGVEVHLAGRYSQTMNGSLPLCLKRKL